MARLPGQDDTCDGDGWDTIEGTGFRMPCPGCPACSEPEAAATGMETAPPTPLEAATLPAAGRTLDARIAAEVFGQHPGKFLPPCYSTDLQAAGLVLEEFRRRWATDDPEEDYWRLVDCEEYGWRAEVWWSHHDGDVLQVGRVGDTLAEAICRCALVYVRGRGGER